MIFRTVLNVIVILVKFSLAGLLLEPVHVYAQLEVENQSDLGLKPQEEQVADSYVEEARVSLIPPIEKLLPLQLQIPGVNHDSRVENTVQNNQRTVEDTDGKSHDKITQLQKKYKGKKGHKSAKFGEKKGHKKGHNTKGYNNRFHKDEYHKEHKLYGDAYNDNHKNTYEDTHNKHAKKNGGYGRSNKYSHSHSDNRFGKKGVDDVGKYDNRHKDFETDSDHKQLNKYKSYLVAIKDQKNPFPNHRPY